MAIGAQTEVCVYEHRKSKAVDVNFSSRPFEAQAEVCFYKNAKHDD